MSGPWEKYKKEGGPWTKYQAAAAPARSQGPAVVPPPEESMIGLAGQAIKETLKEDLPVVGKAVRWLRKDFPEGLAELGGELGHPKKMAAAATVFGTGAELLPATGGELAMEGLAGPALKVGGKIAGKVGLGAKALGKEAVKRPTQLLGQVRGESFERLVGRPKEVLEEISKMSDDPNRIKELGNAFKGALDENFKAAQTAYEDIISKQLLENPKYKGKTFDLLQAVGDDMAKIKKDFGFGQPNRFGASEREAQLFRDLDNLVQGQRRASAETVFNLQKDINRALRNPAIEGTPLQAALGQVDTAMQTYLSKSIPEIGKANDIYSGAKELQTFAKGTLERLEDLPGKVSSAFKRNTAFKDQLEKAADNVPKAREALEAMRDALAAQDFSPRIAKLPATGLATGVGALNLAGVAGNPVAAAGAVAAAPFLSPRLTANVVGRSLQAARKASGRGAAAVKAAEEAAQRIPGSLTIVERELAKPVAVGGALSLSRGRKKEKKK